MGIWIALIVMHGLLLSFIPNSGPNASVIGGFVVLQHAIVRHCFLLQIALFIRRVAPAGGSSNALRSSISISREISVNRLIPSLLVLNSLRYCPFDHRSTGHVLSAQLNTTSRHAPTASTTKRHIRYRAMCLVIFAYGTCGCPPTPTAPYIHLCPAARSRGPYGQACPPGRRYQRTVLTGGPCSMCRQLARESIRLERKELMRRRWVRGPGTGTGTGTGYW
ncbi:hypothetical protein BU26DRAFT_498926 [Trematosphaeria pertusa]|uniref:Secreted protein n=1 Tax=Trematosphaeria pertusa TaxID=390896 RepID=A0A6A6J0K5_9PLEO|nr:uncharacterized protein BU26DRAFT_498926 [Trematosphaeria pertusa]KAF2256229.1 hypothetical protein BU26DRAFT_498926 [Trematosphaeria pertusa]